MTLTSHCICQTRSGTFRTSPPVAMPALLKKTSMRPWRSRARCTSASICAAAPTSHATASPPISSATFAAPLASRSATTTCAPRSANARQLAAPMPLAPPVITQTLPASSTSAVDRAVGDARADADAAAALADRIAVVAVGAVADRDAGLRIGPRELTTRAVVAERELRAGVAEAPVGAVRVACDDHAERPVGAALEHRIGEVARADRARHRERLGAPDLCCTQRAAVQQSLVEEGEVRRRRGASAARNAGEANLRKVEARDRLLRDLADRRLRHAQTLEVLGRQHLADADAVGDAVVLGTR